MSESDTIARFLSNLADASGSAAFVDATRPQDVRTLRRGEVMRIVAGLSGELRRRGLAANARVGLLMPNGLNFALLYLACLHGGFTAIPLNPGFPDQVLEYITATIGADALIRHEDFCDRRAGAARLTWDIFSRDDLVEVGATAPAVEASPVLDRPLAIFFTSGTTSVPKGVCHRPASMIANVEAFNALTGLDRQTRMLHVMPMAYMAGFLNTILSPLAAGGTVVLAPQFDARAALGFWRPVVEHAVDTAWLTPTMMALLVRLSRDSQVKEWATRHMRRIFAGTAPLPAATRAGFGQAFGVPVFESYGMSEVMLLSCETPADAVVPSVGRILSGARAQARSRDGRPLAAGEEGELWLATDYALSGYLDTQAGGLVSPLVDGWMPTGDVGLVDADQRLHITGRIKDLIIHGGTNVSPRAIEEVLLACPGVADAAVVGRPDPFWGEEVVAFVELQPGATMEGLDTAQRCRARLPADAVPARFIAVDALPRNSTGKVLKNELKARLATA